MSELQFVEQCSFCCELHNCTENNLALLVLGANTTNRIVKRTSRFAVMPTLGQFIEGYLLILPEPHYLSYGHMPDNFLNEYQVLEEEVCKVLFSLYGVRPIIFEHGPASEVKRGACCEDHAHMHIVPASVDVLPTILANYSGRPINSLTDLRDQVSREMPYLYYKNAAGQQYVFDAPAVPSQYIRRLIAEQIDLADKWDWAIYPEIAALKKAVARINDAWRIL